MASLYKKRNIWYISLAINNSRITRSLRTKDYAIAKSLKPIVETTILQELTGFTESSLDLSFPELVSRFLKASHSWAPATYEMNRDILSSHLNGNPLPEYPTSRAIHIRHINQCWNWTKGESRDRIYTECELNLIFTSIKDSFCRPW